MFTSGNTSPCHHSLHLFVKTDESQQAGIVQKLSDQALTFHSPFTHLKIENGYTGHVTDYAPTPAPVCIEVDTRHTSGWYDLILRNKHHHHIRWHIAGHIETGSNSTTDPAIGRYSK
ncbi:hypothetical protein F7H86_02240 [Novacetimonas hansenii]